MRIDTFIFSENASKCSLHHTSLNIVLKLELKSKKCIDAILQILKTMEMSRFMVHLHIKVFFISL